MAKPERRDPAKEKFWRRMVQRWLRSGATARDFCLEHDLSEASFYAWRREIVRRDQEVATTTSATIATAAQASCSPGKAMRLPAPLAADSFADGAQPVFVKVTLDDTPFVDAGAVTAPLIEVLVGERRRLLVRPGFDTDQFRQLLRLLEEPSC